MTKFKGTRGPLVATPQDGSPGHCFQAQVFKDDEIGHSVADFRPTENPEEASANAVLYSVAWEMLEELESVVSMFAKGQVITEEKVIRKRKEIEALIVKATTV